MKRISRTLIFMLALLLALMPMSVFADASKSGMTYVSLGDSLAAGLLSDGKTIGKGFVGNIVEQLEGHGYDVSMEKFSVPGATTSDVLAGILNDEGFPAHADIVTISAGANDLLSELDMGKVREFDPNEIARVHEELTTAVTSAFSDTEAAAQDLSEVIEELEQLLDGVKEQVGPIAIILPDDIKEAIEVIETNFENVEEHLSETYSGLELARESVAEGDFDGLSHLTQVLADLEAATENLDEILSAISILEDFPIPDHIREVAAQVKEKSEETKTAVEAVGHAISNGMELIVPLANELEGLLKEAEEIEQMFGNIENKIEAVGKNMAEIVGTTQQLNPQAKIYVMGYYNALPYLPESTQAVTVPLIQGLNSAIEEAAKATGAIFVPTFEAFEGNYGTYLPNHNDIHPSEEGYEALAAAFMSEISKAFPKVSEPDPEPEVPTVQEIVLGEATEVFKGQVIEIHGTKAKLVLPADLPNGTMLTVTATDEEKLAKATNLKAVGDVLNFNFQFPAGFEDFTGVFKLIFRYEYDSGDVAIYYFDEAEEKWTSLDGEVIEEAKEVSVEVTDFSNYGVFAEVVVAPVEDEESDVVADDEKEEAGIEKVEEDDGRGAVEEKKGQGSGGMPKTATNQFNYLLVGVLLIGLGVTLLVVARRRKVFA